MHAPRLVTCALALALASAPRAGPARGEGEPSPSARVLAVAPHRLGWDDPALAASLASDAVAAARRTRLEVLAPGEFEVSDPASRNLLAATDLARVLSQHGLPPRAFLLLRGATERQVTRTVHQLTNGLDTRSALEEETVWRMRLEVLGPDSDDALAEAHGEATRGADAPAPGAEPVPELRQLQARLLAAVLEALEKRLGPAR